MPRPEPRSKKVRTPSDIGDEMTVEMLSTRTGVSVRNIRAYQTAGLMPPPRLRGRLGLYDTAHQGKLELIRDLRQQGFRLDAIRGMLDSTPEGAWPEYALISELFSTTFFATEPPVRKHIAEMATHWGSQATPEQRDRLSRQGLYRPVPGTTEFDVLSPSLERIGIQLSELNVPLDKVLDLQDTLIEHTRAIAKAYVEQVFMALIKEVATATEAPNTTTDRDRIERIKQRFERLRPLAVGSISAAFPVVLQQEFEKAVHKPSTP